MESEGIAGKPETAPDLAQRGLTWARENYPTEPGGLSRAELRTLPVIDNERIKRASFEADPTCRACQLKIEKVEDAVLLDNVQGVDGKGHQLLIHNNCFGDTLGYMARMARIPRRRF